MILDFLSVVYVDVSEVDYILVEECEKWYEIGKLFEDFSISMVYI